MRCLCSWLKVPNPATKATIQLGKKSYLTLLQVLLGRVNFEDGYGLQNSARVEVKEPIKPNQKNVTLNAKSNISFQNSNCMWMNTSKKIIQCLNRSSIIETVTKSISQILFYVLHLAPKKKPSFLRAAWTTAFATAATAPTSGKSFTCCRQSTPRCKRELENIIRHVQTFANVVLLGQVLGINC